MAFLAKTGQLRTPNFKIENSIIRISIDDF